MAVNNGSDVLLKLSTVTVDATTNQDFEWIIDMLDATTKDSSGHKEYIAGEDGGTISIEGKLDESDTLTADDLITTAQAKSSVAFVHGKVAGGSKTISGYCFISNVKISSPQNGVQTWSANMQITGNITLGAVAS
jgi:hypothetical protein